MVYGDSYIKKLGAEGSISPFFLENVNSSSYDMTLADEFGLPNEVDDYKYKYIKTHKIYLYTQETLIARSQEYFKFPDYVSGMVKDKSTLGRSFVTCCNGGAGWFDPGFEGYAVLEIVNNGYTPFLLQAGMTIGQMIFIEVSGCNKPYNGNYQNQDSLALDSFEKAVEKLYVKAKKFYIGGY